MVEENIEKANSKLKEVNELIKPYQLAYIPVEYCEFVKKNARYMDKDDFNQLIENIKKDGFLSQLPFVLKRSEKKYLILSGNHRVKAAIQAGLKYILILYVENIDKDTQLSYQLSHNALIGKDDLVILKELFDEIKDINKKQFTGLSELDFPDFKIDSLPIINEQDIELHEIKFFFTNVRANQVLKLLEILEKEKIDPENTRIVNLDFKEFIKVLTEFKKFTHIKLNTIAFIKILGLVQNYIEKEVVSDGKEN